MTTYDTSVEINLGEPTPLPISGAVTANAGSGTQAVSLSALPALAAGSAKVGSFYQTSRQYVDETGVVRTTTEAFINATLIGNTQVVAAQGTGIKIRVLSVLVVATVGVVVKFQSGTTDKTAGFPLGANGGMVLPPSPHGWFETNANEALNINLSFATATGVQITWAPSV